MVLLEKLVQPSFVQTEEFAQVNVIGDALHHHLSQPDVLILLEQANKPGNSSAKVQHVFLEHAQQLGFESEKKGLFEKYATSGLRPDYYCSVRDTGILLEVERGKTIMNNMDLLDLWKCHICLEAHYLFLMVPAMLAHNENRRSYNTFRMSVNRLSPFFQEGNYTNVRGLFIFGY